MAETDRDNVHANRQIRRGRIHFRPELARPRPIETIPHALPLLLEIARHRCLTSSQTSRLFFQDGLEHLEGEPLAQAIANAHRYVNRSTLRPLKDLQLIQAVRPWLRGSGGGLCRRETHILTETGAALLQSHLDALGKGQQLRWHPSFAEIEGTNQAHAEALVDVYVAFKRAIQPPVVFWGWKDDRELMGLVRERATTLHAGVPDAVFVITHKFDEERRHTPFFVELDRATETVQASDGRKRDWMGKIERYEEYFDGPFHRDPLFRGIDVPPTVLTVTTTHRRLRNLRDATATLSSSTRYLFTTLEAMLANEPRGVLAADIWESSSNQTLALSSVLDIDQ